jgi:hypothetical protein
MDRPKTVSDCTADRLQALTTRLRQCLVDAANVRARFMRALDANAWPDLRSVRRPRFDDDSKAN